MKDFLNADGFAVFTDTLKPSDLSRKHPDLIQSTLKSLRTPLTAIKYTFRNGVDPNVFVRDVYFLEVSLPLVSCILALKAMEIEFVVGSQQWIPSKHAVVEQTPLRIPQTMFHQKPSKRIRLEPGHVLVYNGALVYRNCTADASYLHIPGCIEANRQDLLTRIAHVPAILATPDWTRILPRKLFGTMAVVERWASRFIAEFGVTESQRAEFYRKYSYSTLIPEYDFVRLTNNPSNTPNRITFFENAQKFTTLSAEQTAAFEQVFFTRPYWFLLVSVLFWIVMAMLTILYLIRLWRRRTVPTATPPSVEMCPCRQRTPSPSRSRTLLQRSRPVPPLQRSRVRSAPLPPRTRPLSGTRRAPLPRPRSRPLSGVRQTPLPRPRSRARSGQQIVIKVMSRP